MASAVELIRRIICHMQAWPRGGQQKNPCPRKNWQNPPLSGEAGPRPPHRPAKRGDKILGF